VGYSLSVVAQNQWKDEYGVGHVSRSNCLLHLQASQAKVSQSSLKTDGDAAWMVHMASSWRSRGIIADGAWVNAVGCIGLLYPNFVIIIVLGHKYSLVISFPIYRTSRVGGEVTTQASLSHPLAIVAF
jgi:hypothetical protein